MNIIEETYHKCPACGVEARGIVELNRVFGYRFQWEEIDLYTQCKVCRGVNEFGETVEQSGRSKHGKEEWNTVIAWARRIHISGAKYTSYLLELGELEKESPVMGNVVQWDFDAYADVVHLRVQVAEVHDICPKCKANLDEMPGYDHLEPVHRCSRCGQLCHEWGVSVTFDR